MIELKRAYLKPPPYPPLSRLPFSVTHTTNILPCNSVEYAVQASI